MDTQPLTPRADLADEVLAVLALGRVIVELDALAERAGATLRDRQRRAALARDQKRLALALWQGRPVRPRTRTAPALGWLALEMRLDLGQIQTEIAALEAIGPRTQGQRQRLTALKRDRARLSRAARDAARGTFGKGGRSRLIRRRTAPRPLPLAPATE